MGVGTAVSSLIEARGFRNVILWEVTHYDEPRHSQMHGSRRGGVEINLDMRVLDNRPGFTFHLMAERAGGLLCDPVGRLVTKVLTDVPYVAALRPATQPTHRH